MVIAPLSVTLVYTISGEKTIRKCLRKRRGFPEHMPDNLCLHLYHLY